MLLYCHQFHLKNMSFCPAFACFIEKVRVLVKLLRKEKKKEKLSADGIRPLKRLGPCRMWLHL